MFSNLFKKSKINYASFEDVQFAIKYPEQFIIINTLPIHEQEFLIYNTLSYEKEEQVLNGLLNDYDLKSKYLIVYGKNCNDESVEKKYRQISELGFTHVYLYGGGMFEWLLMQDIYGKEEFNTTNYTLDLLKFKPIRNITGRLL